MLQRWLRGALPLLLVSMTAASCSAERAPFPTPVVGLYAVPAEACSTAAACGFTVVHSYDFESDRPPDVQAWVSIAQPYLDNAAKYGLRVLLGVPRNWLRGRMDAPVRGAIRAVKNHRAILTWYEDEIAQSGDPGAVQFYCDIVAAEDSVHGVILEEGKDLAQFRSQGRVRMFTYYPVTAAARDAGRLKTLRQRFPCRRFVR
jgi:hypothetical protein